MKKSGDTASQFEKAKSKCTKVFLAKMHDYGTSWRVMRASSLTDQILIKAMRIRSIQEKGDPRINEGILPEFVAIVNYCVMALIQLGEGPGEDFTPEVAEKMYRMKLDEATSLMENKNHDYDEAWRLMRVSSMTDIILQKLRRTKEIEDHKGMTICSEGIDANYMDMINYSLFCLIKLSEEENG